MDWCLYGTNVLLISLCDYIWYSNICWNDGKGCLYTSSLLFLYGICICDPIVYIRRRCCFLYGICICDPIVYIRRRCCFLYGICICGPIVYIRRRCCFYTACIHMVILFIYVVVVDLYGTYICGVQVFIVWWSDTMSFHILWYFLYENGYICVWWVYIYRSICVGQQLWYFYGRSLYFRPIFHKEWCVRLHMLGWRMQ